ncbi:MAG: glutathione S-transferase family protein, partial [Candidatus Binatia bacterium]
MIKLYTFPPSTNSRKVRIALIEKGLEFERVNIDLTKREQKSADYLKIHPFGQIPALDDEGFILYDSTIINEYLEDEYPYPSLMPKDSEGRARARLMEDFRDTQFNPSFVNIINEIRK